MRYAFYSGDVFTRVCFLLGVAVLGLQARGELPCC